MKILNYKYLHKYLYRLALLSVFLFAGVNSLFAQFYNGSQMTFGKNRIQYDDERTWVYFRFKSFDTYFYTNGKALAVYASSFAYEEIKRMKSQLDYTLQDKITFMVFNDLSDLKETNIGLLTEDQYNIGGETHIINNKVFIYFDGNHKNFEQQISKGVAKIYLNQIMYGGSLGTTVKNSILLNFPNWFTEGFISFMAEEWSTEIDTKVRDGFLSGRFKDFKRLTPEEQRIAGHSLWKYIYDKYGRRAMADVLFLAKINRSIETGFLYILGKNYNAIMEEWQEWYTSRYINEMSLGFVQPDQAFKKRISKKKRYDHARISDDGKYLSYVENKIGKVRFRLTNLENGRTKTIEKFGYKLNEKVDYSYPVSCFSPSGTFLAYVLEQGNNLVLVLYDLERKKKTKKYINSLDKVLSMSFNNRSNQLVMSAVRRGQSDIFIYGVGSNTLKRITNDIFDDEDPVFVNGSQSILFSSNRRDDTLRFDIETNSDFRQDTLRGMKNKDIFLYEIKKDNILLKRVTATPEADEKQPQYLAYNKFGWLSNESGIYNQMIGKFDSVISYIDTIVHYKHIAHSKIVSRYSHNIKSHQMNIGANKNVMIIPFKNRDYFFIKDLAAFDEMEVYDPIYTGYRIKQQQRKVERAIQQKQAIQDSSKTVIQKKETEQKARKKFKVLYVGESQDTTSIIDSYSNPKKASNQAKRKVISQAPKKYLGEQLFRTKNYEVEYSISELVSQMDFSYMNLSYQPFMNVGTPVYNNQGFAAFMKFGVMDLMEDYRIVAGVKLSPTFQGNEYILSYSNLKKRLDREYTFHRMIIVNNMIEGFNYDLVYDYVHEVFAKYSWPFDQIRSLRTTFNFRNDYQVYKSIEHNSLLEPSVSSNRAGIKLEYVFDNTRNPALNIHHGTRYKIFGEYFQPISELKENTFIVGIDYRKYIPIIGNFIWANRFAASSSFGTQRLIYYLGAVDNWMFPSFNQNIQIDQSQNYIYQTTATNLRGFSQNIRNGNNFAVINSELRLPPFALLGRRPVKSDFLANFQIIGFFDVGTAWNGLNPFDDANSLFRQEFYQKPITVIVINQNEPIVAGYGFGVRSRLFGYFIRADWAWGVQNGFRQKSKFYLSLSLDF